MNQYFVDSIDIISQSFTSFHNVSIDHINSNLGKENVNTFIKTVGISFQKCTANKRMPMNEVVSNCFLMCSHCIIFQTFTGFPRRSVWITINS